MFGVGPGVKVMPVGSTLIYFVALEYLFPAHAVQISGNDASAERILLHPTSVCECKNVNHGITN
jgi:hypothetical protein